MFLKRSSNHVGSNQYRDALGTEANCTSNPTASHENNPNTRSTNLNELMYVKYSNEALNNNLIFDELQKHHPFCCENAVKVEGADKGNLSVDSGDFFEGVEKLLEVWFTTQSGNTENCDLRRIPRYELLELIQIYVCKDVSNLFNILSTFLYLVDRDNFKLSFYIYSYKELKA